MPIKFDNFVGTNSFGIGISKLRTLRMEEGWPVRFLNPWIIAEVDKKGAACIAHQASPAYPRFSPVEEFARQRL
jgi:hypothetical protein